MSSYYRELSKTTLLVSTEDFNILCLESCMSRKDIKKWVMIKSAAVSQLGQKECWHGTTRLRFLFLLWCFICRENHQNVEGKTNYAEKKDDLFPWGSGKCNSTAAVTEPGFW